MLCGAFFFHIIVITVLYGIVAKSRNRLFLFLFCENPAWKCTAVESMMVLQYSAQVAWRAFYWRNAISLDDLYTGLRTSWLQFLNKKTKTQKPNGNGNTFVLYYNTRIANYRHRDGWRIVSMSLSLHCTVFQAYFRSMVCYDWNPLKPGIYRFPRAN